MMSSNEMQTEDKNSAAMVTGRRPDTLDMESEELSNRMRPESGNRKKTGKHMDHLLKDYKVESPSINSSHGHSKCAIFKAVSIAIGTVGLIFAMCLNAFHAYHLTSQAL